jgi:Domain of unknown function (DUF6531)
MGLGPSQAFAGPRPGGVQDNDPVDLPTGLFLYERTDLIVPDVIPIVIKRSHRSGTRAGARSGSGWRRVHPVPRRGSHHLSVGRADLARRGRIDFSRVSPGTDKPGAVFEHTATPTALYKARMAWNPTGLGFDLTLTSGLTYQFSGHNASHGQAIWVRGRSPQASARTSTGTS